MLIQGELSLMNLPPSVFVDTSFFIALLNSADRDHAQAVAIQQQLKAKQTRKITSEFVLMELADGLARLRFRRQAVRLIQLVHQDTTFRVVPASPDLFRLALALYESRQDKEWGMTDCSSFVVMDQLGLTHSLSADRHFQQAGYHVLLLNS